MPVLLHPFHSLFPRLDVEKTKKKGAQLDPLFQSSTLTMREMWNQSWDINTVGTQIMTYTFVPLLLKSSDPRLLFLASGTSSLAGSLNFGLPMNRVPAEKGWPKKEILEAGVGSIPAYRACKCGLNMVMREWDRVLKEDGVKVWCISPGFLATGLGGNPEATKSAGAGDPATAGEFVRAVLEGERDGDVGQVLLRGSGVQPW